MTTFPDAGGRGGAMGSMKLPQLGQNCSSAATLSPHWSHFWETTSLLRSGIVPRVMLVLAVRTYEPWTVTSFFGGLILLALIGVLLIVAAQRGNR